MLSAMVSGKLVKPAASKTSKNGNPYVAATILAPSGQGESVIVNAIAFSDSVCETLLSLQPGDAVTLAGQFKPTAWSKDGGELAAGVSMTAHAVLTVADGRPPRRDKPQWEDPPRPAPGKARGRTSQRTQEAPPRLPYDDEIPF